MKDKTKLAFLMTLLLMSGVGLSSCDNTTKTQISEPETTAKVISVPQDTVVAEQPVQAQTKQYANATAKVKAKNKKQSKKQKQPDRFQETEQYEYISAEKAEYLRQRQNNIGKRLPDKIQESEEYEYISPEKAKLLKEYDAQHTK